MLEFELYVPVLGPDTKSSTIASIKERLRERFGGFTYFPQESHGEWKMGGVGFTDRIVILRVLTADAEATEWFRALRQELAQSLNQTDFLITAKPVQRVEEMP